MWVRRSGHVFDGGRGEWDGIMLAFQRLESSFVGRTKDSMGVLFDSSQEVVHGGLRSVDLVDLKNYIKPTENLN